MVNEFKDYFRRHGEAVHENPSPGNKEGGITTLEEKSLGCIQKGGRAPVKQVVGYGESAKQGLGGLCLVEAPGNDGVSCTALAAAGAHAILFTTGRGTPLGVPVPTLKIASNHSLAERKPGWIDFDAGRLLDPDASVDKITDDLMSLILDVASGKEAKNERNGFREITIWKQGVTL
jgi:altronate hydrolase